MIVSRTPFRLSFFGGGTDYPSWYREHGGSVLATTINKYCYLSCRHLPPFFEHRIRLVYSKIENCQTIDEIQHPAAREILKFVGVRHGIEIHHDGDLPAGSGMGSSSAFTVGLLHALNALKGRMPSKRQLAEESIHIEQELIRETVGSQDQVSAAYGGFNHVVFGTNGDIDVRPLTLSTDRVSELTSNLMLFFTGVKRTASRIAGSYVNHLGANRVQLEATRQLVDEGLSMLNSDTELSRFGELLHEAWQIKRSLGQHVSNAHIDEVYDAARAAGAIGGKITGAGGGGFLLLFVPPERQQFVRQRLSHLIHVPFRFEYGGSQIIFYETQEDFSSQEADRASRSLTPFRELEIDPDPE
ncbi:MAG: hypothetical protein Q7S20_06175 [Gemmatimonadaceae bacterium]|nr:hypothetical protein [Gemmatimonadaceae bacterium]